MEQLAVENELREVVARIISEVSLATDQRRTDINLALEDALLPILKTTFHLPHLKNLNSTKRNYPGIDLGDDHNRTSFQVTSTTSLEKVKTTLSTFIERQYFNDFDTLYVLVLLNKQSSYSQAAVDKVTDKKFEFNTRKHIIDLGDVLRLVSGRDLSIQKNILREFKIILGDVVEYRTLQETPVQVPTELMINMAEISVPEHLYVAEVSIDEKGVLEEAREKLNAKRANYSKRSLVRMALTLQGISATSWVYHDKRIFTFMPIEGSPIEGVIDIGTCEQLHSSDLYDSGSESNLNVFKQLLGAELEEQLNSKQVARDRKDRFFYFNPVQEGYTVRNERWVGKAKAKRNVFETVMQTKDPTKIAHCKHLRFDIAFIRLDTQWYVSIVPSWFYSYNGYRSRFHESLLSKQKRLEFNHSVRNHVRFIAYFLKSLGDTTGRGLIVHDLAELESFLEAPEGEEEST